MTSPTRHLYSGPLVAVLLWHTGAYGQALNDPTRPPSMAVPTEKEAETPRHPVLQSVIITPTHRAAIIDGERVELGGRYRDARVSRITETEVLLRSGARTEVLKMYPNVDKALKRDEPVPAAPATARARNTKG